MRIETILLSAMATCTGVHCQAEVPFTVVPTPSWMPFPQSDPVGISSDGSTILFTASTLEGADLACRWSATGGVQTVGISFDQPGCWSLPLAVSGDGTVVLSYGRSTPGGNPENFRWSDAEGRVPLPNPDGNPSYVVDLDMDISDDGLRVVGTGEHNGNLTAVLWDVGRAPRPAFGSDPAGAALGLGVSPGGEFVTGSILTNGQWQAYRWSETQGLDLLTNRPAAWTYLEGTRISIDGSVIAGNREIGSSDFRAIRWTTLTGFDDLPGNPAEPTRSRASDMSANGELIVGEVSVETDPSIPDIEYYPELGNIGAVYWDASNVLHDIQQELVEEYGANLDEWHLASARSVSADGHKITGVGLWSRAGSGTTYRVGWVFDRNARPPTLKALYRVGGNLVLEYEPGPSNATHVVESATTPGIVGWSPVATTNDQLGSMTIPLPSGPAQSTRVFRVKRIEP